MATYDGKPCPCGSGLMSRWVNDARGIPLARCCDRCRQRRLAEFRPEVLTDPGYETTEDVDAD